VERPEREHLLLEVLEDRLIDAFPQLFGGLAVARVVREPAARRLELTRVEDELTGGPGTARLDARGGVRLGVGGIGCEVQLDRGLRLSRLGQERARRDEPGN